MKNNSMSIGRSFLFCTFHLILAPFFTNALAANPSLHSDLSKYLDFQQTEIRGKITDVNGVPIADAHVMVQSTSNGVVSKMDGSYTIQANSDDILIFSALGFVTQTIPINNRLEINIQLQEDVTQLDEVTLNAGYYTVKEKERTGSISRITANDIEIQPVSNPLSTMQGRMAGVNITQLSGVPGGGFDIQIRGKNFIAGGTDPLFIVDGVPYGSESLESPNVVGGGILPGGLANLSPLNAISTGDIESIEVLKDADATAIYGSRGANGVVLITTKKGKVGKTKVSVNLSSSLGEVTRFLDLMNTEQYLEMRREALVNDGLDPLPVPFESFFPDLFAWDQNRYTDWQEKFIGGTAYRNNAQLSFSGGSTRTQFLLSGTYLNETTVFPGDPKYSKGSVLTNINHRSKDNRIALNFSATYVSEDNQLPANDFTVQGQRLAPNAPALYDEEGNLNWENSTWINPLAQLENEYRAKIHNLIANTVISYRPIPSLELKTNLGYTEYQLESYRTSPHTRFDPAFGLDSQASSIRFNNATRRSWIIEPQFNWQKKWGNASLNILMGATFQQEKVQSFSDFGIGFPSNSLLFDLSSATTVSVLQDQRTEYNYQAFFGRVNFNWKEKYFLNLTGRRDGSSRFGPGRQFGNFGAVGAAWLFSEEVFLKDNPLLSFAKLRASYGITGSDNIGDYKFLDTYSTSGTNYNGITGLLPTGLFNPIFGWEENKKLEAALELGFWKDRMFLSTAWYLNRSFNQLVGIPLPATTGFNSLTANFDATVENTGVEIELNAVNIQKENFKWTTTFNITVPKNKLVKFPGLEGSTFANTFVVGESLSIRKLYHATGVDPETGVYQFEDYNNDGVISSPEDRQWLENLDPKFYGSLGNTLKYGNLELNFFFQFKKQKAFNYLSLGANPGAGGPVNQSVEFLDRWQEPGDTAHIQRYSVGFLADVRNAASRQSRSSAAVSDASFIRLRNVALTYTLPKTVTKGIDCSIYLQGQNLFVITQYKGADPEQRFQQNLPPLRQFTLGLDLSF